MLKVGNNKNNSNLWNDFCLKRTIKLINIWSDKRKKRLTKVGIEKGWLL